MARRPEGSSLTIAALEQMLEGRRRKLDALKRERAQVQKKLDQLDAKIRSLSGGAGGAGRAGGRAHNPMSLVAAMQTAIKSAGKPLPVGEILAKVESLGYRSKSANFRALVNQTLIKDDRFVAAKRGVYQLTK